MTIPLISESDVTWSVNGQYEGRGSRVNFMPSTSGEYVITAMYRDSSEHIRIRVIER